MKEFTTHDDFDALMSAVIKKKAYTLSDKQEQMHQMLMHAATLLREYGLASKCIKLFADFHKISDSTARNYLNAAPRYYSIVEPLQEANFIKSAVYAKILETRALIETLGDEKERIKALNQNDKNLLDYCKILPSSEAIDWDKMKPQITINTFEPTLVVEAEMTEEELRKEIIELGLVETSNSSILTYEED